ncbi:uncharacterized protein CLAFUR5_13744 [Fulvia fulva]|uniref:RRM domain-containing protein n=1 Tax=Passalora fulva TaxID=5499 RepID=A0A9Q8UWD7_PASFU|nr:uncharacterized protein CLAFUR5_13744 [Fulvia fulva]UJO24792.1 hypothetical protein CLAFUR5_13744 [Fulvia fulva]WPV37117.1 hypothetical protein CLAFUW7_13910 [Fulvia fulva]
MSADTKGKKRKSGDNIVPAAKKIKTRTEINVAKSADRPDPVKFALKKSKTTVVEKANGKNTKAAKTVIEEPVAADSEEADTIVSDAEEGGATLTADQTEALLAGFTDSEDEDEDDKVDEGIDLANLPAPPKAKKPPGDKPSDPENTPGAIYIGRLPHGFFEKQLHAYLSQFGTITPGHLRLARNKKTGKSKHYAFIEFESASVADIVAKTMDKYLLFGHILQVRRVPAEQVTEGMWEGPKGVKGGKARPRNRIEGTRLRKGAEREVWEGRVTREQQRRDDKAKKLAEMGYDFDMPDVKAVKSVPAQKKVEDTVTLHLEDKPTKLEEPVEVVKPEEGVKLIEGKKKKRGKNVEKNVEKVVEAVEDAPVVKEETTVKRKNKATGTTSTTKRRKVKAAA